MPCDSRARCGLPNIAAAVKAKLSGPNALHSDEASLAMFVILNVARQVKLVGGPDVWQAWLAPRSHFVLAPGGT